MIRISSSLGCEWEWRRVSVFGGGGVLGRHKGGGGFFYLKSSHESQKLKQFST